MMVPGALGAPQIQSEGIINHVVRELFPFHWVLGSQNEIPTRPKVVENYKFIRSPGTQMG